MRGLRRVVLGHIVSESGQWTVASIAEDLDETRAHIAAAVASLYARGFVRFSAPTEPLHATREGVEVLGVAKASRTSSGTLEVRDQILTALEAGERTSEEMAGLLGVSRTTIDAHVRSLRAMGEIERAGQADRSPKGGRPALRWRRPSRV